MKNLSDEQIDEMAKMESNRLTKVEIWILGSLAHLGLLKWFRNSKQKGVNWQFATDYARIKLKHLCSLIYFSALQTNSVNLTKQITNNETERLYK